MYSPERGSFPLDHEGVFICSHSAQIQEGWQDKQKQRTKCKFKLCRGMQAYNLGILEVYQAQQRHKR
jgi:dihydroxyacetone kinase DhaKLM complex PTS-EIIA-like component DhaM